MRRPSRFVRSVLAGMCLGFGITTDAAAQQLLTCPTAVTLDTLATCIRLQMPQANSGLYVPPSAAEQADFGTVVRQMLDGACSFDLPASLAANYQVRVFRDSATARSYCLLMEVLDATGPGGVPDGIVDKGWGTFIVNANATRRTLNQSAPHPIFDRGTENQAINIFQDTESLSYLMCGSHRHANGSTGGTCQIGFGEADCAHQDNTMFHAAVVALNEFYGATPWTHIQWHGKSANMCPTLDVYGSQGFSTAQPPDSNVSSLKDLMAVNQPDVVFALTGTGAGCSLNATENVEGRYLNGAPDICGSNDGATPTNKFVHLEQAETGQSGAQIRRAEVWDLSVMQNWPIP